jgi:hypothetical protein
VAGQSGRNDCADADLHFFNWAGTQLAPTAQLGPPSKTGTVLIETSHSDILPTGTRRVHIALTFPGDDSMADDIAFALAAPSGPPVITPGGIISASRPVLGLR